MGISIVNVSKGISIENSLLEVKQLNDVKKVYALKSRADFYSVSSSGGAFMEIAKVFFELYKENAYVFGVVFDDNMKLKYSAANDLTECLKFCGSKYIFSNMSRAPASPYLSRKYLKSRSIFFPPCINISTKTISS